MGTACEPESEDASAEETEPETTVSRSGLRTGAGNRSPGTVPAGTHVTRSALTLSVGASPPPAARSFNSSAETGPSTRPSALMYHSGTMRTWVTRGDRSRMSLLSIQFIQLVEQRLHRWPVVGRVQAGDVGEHHVPLLVEN